jgi:hypothetical protein
MKYIIFDTCDDDFFRGMVQYYLTIIYKKINNPLQIPQILDFYRTCGEHTHGKNCLFNPVKTQILLSNEQAWILRDEINNTRDLHQKASKSSPEASKRTVQVRKSSRYIQHVQKHYENYSKKIFCICENKIKNITPDIVIELNRNEDIINEINKVLDIVENSIKYIVSKGHYKKGNDCFTILKSTCKINCQCHCPCTNWCERISTFY